ncbi:Unconventional myosin-Ig [Labeo rohita]|uniref:Unconventional myosin-Ig n=1 Tax=Labeo rohita TaxID=84645 RepID=A0ABQ8LQE3_LABRO|nr:Unconventional myosin-Ig [Labeo rohita]
MKEDSFSEARKNGRSEVTISGPYKWLSDGNGIGSRVKNTPLPVKVCSTSLQVHMSGKPKSITVETKPGQTVADFKKSRTGFTLLLPHQ